MSETLKAAALALAADGVRVFPVGLDKAPHTANGFHDGTTNPEAIKQWDWSGMIGACISPGLVVIDVDPRNGGSDTIKLLRDEGKALPPTRTARTKSGGWHYYLRIPEDVVLRGKLGPGVDVKRAGKGYVVSPPSPGYSWLGDAQPTEAPEWLLEELVVEPQTGDLAEPSAPKFMPWEDGTAYGQAALEREMGRLGTAMEGERNDALNRAAFAMAQLAAGGEVSRKKVVNDLTVVGLRIGLSMEECQSTIKSGWAAGMAQPRQAPPLRERIDAEALAPALPERSQGVRLPEAHGSGDGEEMLWVDWTVEEEPPPFYLSPVVPQNAYVLVYGATEASKSMVWHGLLAQASCLDLRCSVYSLENPPATDRERLRRLKPDPANFRLTNAPIDFNDPRQLEALMERERDWGTNLLLIDTYSHAFNSRSEDGNAKAIDFARRVRYIMHEVGCTVIVIDHTGYAQAHEPRDASAKRQQVDVAILMEKAGEWRPGQPAQFVMTNHKAARFGNPFHYRGEIRDTKGDVRGLEIAWLGEPPKWETS